MDLRANQSSSLYRQRDRGPEEWCELLQVTHLEWSRDRALLTYLYSSGGDGGWGMGMEGELLSNV